MFGLAMNAIAGRLSAKMTPKALEAPMQLSVGSRFKEESMDVQEHKTKWLELDMNPALAHHARKRAESIQNSVADRITTFAGSMGFVYIHIIWFAVWIVFRIEDYPFGLLTMIVSLEAIFLSTFVMISQNRADAKHQVV